MVSERHRQRGKQYFVVEHRNRPTGTPNPRKLWFFAVNDRNCSVALGGSRVGGAFPLKKGDREVETFRVPSCKLRVPRV
jgi:hypothetical protein